jgi:hypothetical protein
MTETERLRLESIAARLRDANPPEHSDPGWESRRKLPPYFAGAAEVLDYLSACRAADDAQVDLRRLLEPAVVLDDLLTGPRRHCNRQEFGQRLTGNVYADYLSERGEERAARLLPDAFPLDDGKESPK